MSYATGTADTRETLLDLFKTFAIASGWSLDRYELRNTGAILDIHKAGVTETLYAHLRSVYFEDLPGLSAGDFAGITVSMSESYDSSKDATNQPGAPLNLTNASQWYNARISGFTPVSKYWFFSSSSPTEFLAMVVLLPGGTYRHIIIGEVEKYDATVLGGAFFYASEGWAGGGLDTLPFYAAGFPWSNPGASYVHLNADERDGWWGPGWVSSGGELSLIGATVSHPFTCGALAYNSVNQFSNASALVQANLFLKAQTGLWAIFSRIPNLRYSRRSAFLVDTVYPLGADNWMAFPLYSVNSNYALVYKKVT